MAGGKIVADCDLSRVIGWDPSPMAQAKHFETQWGGKTLSIEVGKYANQANGSCLVRYGDTIVLGTAVMSAQKREGLEFFPLMVEYEEKLYAAGRIKGSRFVKRPGRPTDEAVLTARFVDRAIRPLFDDRLRNEIQIVLSVFSFDEENDPDIAALIAASCALHISNIPWEGPIASIRVGQVEGERVINPTYLAREKSILDLAFAGTTEKIVMVEAGAREAEEQTVLDAFWFGQKHLKEPMALIEEVHAAVGKEKRTDLLDELSDDELRVQELARPFIEKQVEELFFGSPKAMKVERAAAKSELKSRVKKFLLEQKVEEALIGAGTNTVETIL
ncbi:MAG TPA: hypothetical protein VI874_05565, partial [Candidatus Norongarragalinales archaeon]|nr:hypothetical protein [Candidatus Norongarragalinales archaeon]